MWINSILDFIFPQKLGPNRTKITYGKQKSSVDSVFKLKEAKIYLYFLFSLCVLHPGRHPVCNTTSRFVSGSGRAVTSSMCEMCVRT